MKFTATLELFGKTATGIEIPPAVLESLGGGKKPAVVVTLGSHTYRTTVGVMGGKPLISVSAEQRKAAGLEAGQTVEVTVAPDDAPRTVEVPAELAAALTPTAREFFDGLAPSHRKEWVRWIEEAKKAETRASRVEKAAAALAEGKKTR